VHSVFAFVVDATDLSKQYHIMERLDLINYLFGKNVFEVRASHLLGRHSSSSTTSSDQDGYVFFHLAHSFNTQNSLMLAF
jgi:hypothetical protein